MKNGYVGPNYGRFYFKECLILNLLYVMQYTEIINIFFVDFDLPNKGTHANTPYI